MLEIVKAQLLIMEVTEISNQATFNKGSIYVDSMFLIRVTRVRKLVSISVVSMGTLWDCCHDYSFFMTAVDRAGKWKSKMLFIVVLWCK